MEIQERVIEVRFLEPLLIPDVVADKTLAEVQDALDRPTPIDQTNQVEINVIYIQLRLYQFRQLGISILNLSMCYRAIKQAFT